MKTNISIRVRFASLGSTCVICFLSLASVEIAGAQTNTKTGVGAGAKLTTGKNNTADGFRALFATKTGSFNTAVGGSALTANLGSSNVAVGFQALFKNKNGNFNVALGDGALRENRNGKGNIGIGEDGGFNITGDNNICIGNKGISGQSGVIRIGTPGTHNTTFIAGTITGNGSGLTGVTVPAASITGAISGGQISSNSISTTQLAPAAVISDRLASNLTLSGTTTGTFSGTFSGNGAGLTALDGSQVNTGTIADGRLSSNVALKNAANTFTSSGNNTTTISGAGEGSIGVQLPGQHVVLIESTQDFASSILALKSGDNAPTSADNFITFYNSNGGAMGAIEGVNSTTTAYKTTGADFAEILPVADSAEPQVPAEIVPVHKGEIGNWAKADHFMVISDQAGFVGNDPGRDVEAKGRHHRIAFLGQVPVKVNGPVNAGDYIIASEKNDGTGIAIAAQDVEVTQMNRVVGRAWEGSSEEGLKTVNTAVGLDQTSLVVPALKRLERENQELRERLEKLEARLAEPAHQVQQVLNH